jgi:hypothetical protein
MNPTEYLTDEYQMFYGQADAVLQRYHKHIGKSGNTWLVADSDYAAENVYVTNNPQNTTSKGQGFEGFGGATLKMPLVDGSIFELHGGWHSNSDALFADTGIDVRDKYRTFVVLAMDKEYVKGTDSQYRFKDVVYRDAAPVIGRFNRYKELINQYPEARVYYSSSHGGNLSGWTDAGYKWLKEEQAKKEAA